MRRVRSSSHRRARWRCPATGPRDRSPVELWRARGLIGAGRIGCRADAGSAVACCRADGGGRDGPDRARARAPTPASCAGASPCSCEILRTHPWPAAGAIAGAVVFAAASVAGAVDPRPDHRRPDPACGARGDPRSAPPSSAGRVIVGMAVLRVRRRGRPAVLRHHDRPAHADGVVQPAGRPLRRAAPPLLLRPAHRASCWPTPTTTPSGRRSRCSRCRCRSAPWCMLVFGDRQPRPRSTRCCSPSGSRCSRR